MLRGFYIQYRILEYTSSIYNEKHKKSYLESKFYPQFKKGFFSKWQDFGGNNGGTGYSTIAEFETKEEAEIFLQYRLLVDKEVGVKIHEFPKKELSLEEQAAAHCNRK